MAICIDSCVFIRGLQTNGADATDLLVKISPSLPLVIPRLIAQEVTRNLTDVDQIRRFYGLFYQSDFAFIVDQPVPRDLVFAFIERGLPEKADAFIGAFAEWMQVDWLISDNRHFLRDLKTDAYGVLTPAAFLQRNRSAL